MLGILLIDKPLGITSHDVVHEIRKRFGTRRVGHAGTLDPMATGLLVVAIGPATRFLQYLPLEPKEYVGEFLFGIETLTQDREGEIVAEKPVPGDLEAQFADVVPQFSGLIKQLPPMHSAVKKAGKPLYYYARKGEEVERDPRTVHIETIEVRYVEGPRIGVRIVCSGGTYVRTLAHDMGQAIGCGAYLSELRRTRVGRFGIEEAITFEGANKTDLLSLKEALPPVPLVQLNLHQTEAIREGQQIGVGPLPSSPVCGLLDTGGEVIGMARVQGNVLQPECVIPLEAVHGA